MPSAIMKTHRHEDQERDGPDQHRVRENGLSADGDQRRGPAARARRETAAACSRARAGWSCENCSAAIIARFSRTISEVLPQRGLSGHRYWNAKPVFTVMYRPKVATYAKYARNARVAHRDEHQAAPHHQHDHAAEIHAVGELFAAQLGGELVGIEQRQVDVHRSLRGEAQVVSALGVRPAG